MAIRLALKVCAPASEASTASAPASKAIVIRIMGLSLQAGFLVRPGSAAQGPISPPGAQGSGQRGAGVGIVRGRATASGRRRADLGLRAYPLEILGDGLPVRGEGQRPRQAVEREVAGLDRVVSGLEAAAPGRGPGDEE